ncbi:MAG: hypothetical protein LKF52_07850 [Butyrivibrio sp.]|jgi:hypothetical protein|nr:hypothetical protein [Butyrivibrio sp.]
MQIRKKIRGIMMAFGLIMILIYIIADCRYISDRHVIAAGKITHLQEVIETEKLWIKSNQSTDGYIYMNASSDQQKSREINPYFACQAVRGLLAGDVSASDMTAAEQYINWQIRMIIEQNGVITNYSEADGKLNSTGSADSVDAYIAVFLDLTGRYIKAGGNIDHLQNLDTALTLCSEELKKILNNGMTAVSETNKTVYLMDNAELYEGCRQISSMLKGNGGKYAELAAWYGKTADECKRKINASLWNQKEKRYEVGINPDGSKLEFQGWDVFYPDAIAQIYPYICGVQKKSEAIDLYQRICQQYDWQHLQIPGEEFEWPELAYAATLCGDPERAELYVDEFENKYAVQRKYPLHTANAGWVAISGSHMISEYHQWENRGIIQSLFIRS